MNEAVLCLIQINIECVKRGKIYLQFAYTDYELSIKKGKISTCNLKDVIFPNSHMTTRQVVIMMVLLMIILVGFLSCRGF